MNPNRETAPRSAANPPTPPRLPGTPASAQKAAGKRFPADVSTNPHHITYARHALRELADAYDTLAEIALNGPDPNARTSQRRARPADAEPAEAHDGEHFTLANTPTPAYLPAIDARTTISAYATRLTRTVIEHRHTEHQQLATAAAALDPGPARDAAQRLAEAASPWTPTTTDPATLLRTIADHHIGAILPADPLDAADHLDTLREHVKHARRAAWPTGARWVRLHVPCAEPDCPGEYRTHVHPGRDTLDDLVCDENRDHRIDPDVWFRAMRRNPATTAEAARIARTLRLAGKTVA